MCTFAWPFLLALPSKMLENFSGAPISGVKFSLSHTGEDSVFGTPMQVYSHIIWKYGGRLYHLDNCVTQIPPF